MIDHAFFEARKLLENVTPLKTDCGLLCDHACCKPSEDAGQGVWLFPQEECEDMAWGKKGDTRLPVTRIKAKILLCDGLCDRENRPFQCRIFPLVPFFSKKRSEWDVRMDRRAYMICPLCTYGKKALDPAFIENAKKAVQLIAKTEAGERFLTALAQEESAYRISL